MIDKMTRYSFILLNGEETAFLEQLQEVGLVDITRSEKPMNEVSMGIAGEIERIDGLIKGLEKVDIPEGTKPVTYTGEGSDDLLRLANGTLMDYAEITPGFGDPLTKPGWKRFPPPAFLSTSMS